MKIYEIEIYEHFSKRIRVKAESEFDAVQMASEIWNEGKEVLLPEDSKKKGLKIIKKREEK